MIASLTRNPASRRPLTIVVGAKVFKKAVTRNLLRRRTRAILRPFLKDFKTPILVRFSPQASRATFTELAADLERQIKNIFRNQ